MVANVEELDVVLVAAGFFADISFSGCSNCCCALSLAELAGAWMAILARSSDLKLIARPRRDVIAK